MRLKKFDELNENIDDVSSSYYSDPDHIKPTKPKLYPRQDDEDFDEISSTDTNYVTKEVFVDEFLDRLYMNGSKEDGKYILTLPEATQVANEIYNEFIKNK